MSKPHDTALLIAMHKLAKCHDGMSVRDFSSTTGQSHRTAHRWLDRAVRAGMLHMRVGCSGGLSIARYWLDAEACQAYRFEQPKQKPPMGKRVAAEVRLLPAIGQGGATISMLVELTGLNRENLVARTRSLVAKGKLHQAEDRDERNHRINRFFASTADRDAWYAAASVAFRARDSETKEVRMARKAAAARVKYAKRERLPPKPRTRRDNEIAERLHIVSKAKEKVPPRVGIAHLPGEADTSQAKITRIEPPPNMGNRYYVAPESVPMYRYGSAA